jgi:hypothetical protein
LLNTIIIVHEITLLQSCKRQKKTSTTGLPSDE